MDEEYDFNLSGGYNDISGSDFHTPITWDHILWVLKRLFGWIEGGWGYINDDKYDQEELYDEVDNIHEKSYDRNTRDEGGQESADEGGGGVLEAATAFGAIGLAGSGIGTLDGTFRLTNGSKGNISPKYYTSGWKGGSPARISTYSAAKVGNGISAGANIVTTGIAMSHIYSGQAQPITYADAGVGVMGVIASGTSYFYGVQIPVVGEFVAIYGAARVTWDVFYHLGFQYGPRTWYGTNDHRWFK